MLSSAPPIDEATPTQRRPWWRQPAVVAFLSAPALYGLLIVLQPSDPFSAWHADIVWPARHFLTNGTPGIVLPLFAFFMLGGIGSFFVAVVVQGIMSVLGRIVPLPRLADWLGVAVLIGMPVWAFGFVKAVPPTVTVIASDPARLVVHRFGIFSRLPLAVQTIGRDEIVGLDLFTSWEGRTRTLLLKLGALTRSTGGVVLGARECEGGHSAAAIETCLKSGDSDLLELARSLDLAPTGAVDGGVRKGHRLLRVAPGNP